MVTTSEIGDIFFSFLRKLSVQDVQRGWNFTDGEVLAERVTVSVKTTTHGGKWSKAFAEVNVCVPDLPNGDADLIRLEELEREYTLAFGINTGVHDGTAYRFARESSGLLADNQLRLHYINIRVKFEYLNFINQWQSRFPQ